MAQIPLLNGTTPAAPSGYQNARWQQGPSTGDDPTYGVPIVPDSCYVPNTGIAVVKTLAYTLSIADMGKLIVANSSSPITFTLPNPVPLNALSTPTTETRWNVRIANIGTGALTLAHNGLQIDGVASDLTFSQFTGAQIFTDGTNYFAERGQPAVAPPAGVASLNSLTGPLSIVAGANVTVSASGSSITISSSGGGGGGGLGITLFNGVGGLAPTQAGAGLTTALNQSGHFSAVDESGAGIFLQDLTPAGGEHIEGILRAYPSSPFTLTAVLSVPGSGSNSLAGIAIAASTTGKLIFFGVRWSSAPGWAILSYNSPSSFNAFIVNQTFFSAAMLGIRLQDDGTNIYISFSVDGYAWTLIYTVAKASAFVGSTGFNFLGPIIDPLAAVSSTVLAWNITSP